MSSNKRDLTLYDATCKIVVDTKHLEAIEYLLASNVRYDTTPLDKHHTHLQNAREVITRALTEDRPNHPKGVNAFWGGEYKK